MTAAPFVNPHPLPGDAKRIALFLDGTYNTVADNTNVWRLKRLCDVNDQQICYYSAGVGTAQGKNLVGGLIGDAANKFLGGAIGYGLDKEVLDAYQWLIDCYNPGDQLYLFGFSRGAFTARSLSGLLSKCGIMRPGSPMLIKQIYDRYRLDDSVSDILELGKLAKEGAKLGSQDEWMLRYSRSVGIRFLGVWDTVGSLGISFGTIPEISKSTYHFLETDLRINNDAAFHALAIDEHRLQFAPTLWSKELSNQTRDRSIYNVEQRWFVGAHSNVGGGYESDLLAQRPLQWLMQKATDHGLGFRDTVTAFDDMYNAPITDSYAEFLHGTYKLLPTTEPYFRTIGGAPLIAGKQNEAITINETIDCSVFERYRRDPAYRPKNLNEWANEHKVDLANVHSAISAKEPQMPIEE